MKSRRLITLSIVAAILASSAPAFALDKVRMRLDWVFGAEHSGIFVAAQKDYFKDEGIDVEILPGEGSSVTVKLVGTGDVEFGYATADQGVLAC